MSFASEVEVDHGLRVISKENLRHRLAEPLRSQLQTSASFCIFHGSNADTATSSLTPVGSSDLPSCSPCP